MTGHQYGLLRVVLLLFPAVLLLLLANEAVVEAETRAEAGNSLMSRLLDTWRSFGHELCTVLTRKTYFLLKIQIVALF
jgi:predicted N-acetyltransferase YhbS